MKTQNRSDAHEAIKAQIISVCRRLEQLGFFIGTWGNVSVRVPEGFIITPSRISYDVMQTEDFVVVSNDGTVLSGHRLPSSETGVHRALFNKKPDIGAIVHSHSPCASAVSCLQRAIPVFVEDVAQIIGGAVKCTHYVPAGHHRKFADEIMATIGDENAVLLANHGVVCCGRDLDEAVVACQILEKAAFMMLIAGALGEMIPIPHEVVQAERHRFLYKYGTSNDT